MAAKMALARHVPISCNSGSGLHHVRAAERGSSWPRAQAASRNLHRGARPLRIGGFAPEAFLALGMRVTTRWRIF